MEMAGTRSTGNKVRLWATFLNFLFQIDFGRENSASLYRQGRQLLLAFLTMVTRCSRSPVPLTGEVMRKIYAASGNVFTDSWSWQSFVSSYDILNCLFNWMYKMKYSCHQDSSVIHGWFIYWVFGWEMRRLLKSVGNPISDDIIFKNELRLHSLCIGGAGGTGFFFKGARFLHIPYTSYKFFWHPFSWAKEKITAPLRQS